MATIANAQVIGNVDDPIEEAEFRVNIQGIGEYDFSEVDPLGQAEIQRIIRDYGALPQKLKTLSSKITFEPVKFVTYLLANDDRLRRLTYDQRPRRGNKSTTKFQVQVDFLDRDGGTPFGIRFIDMIFYSTAGSKGKADSNNAATFTMMGDPFDWEWTDIT